jgi:multiple sugar transport system permease protein
MRTATHRLLERERRLAFWMLLPAFAVVAALVAFPVVWNFWLSLKPVLLADLRGRSLFEFNLTLANFRQVLSDPGFGSVLLTTLVYTVGGSALSILLGLAAALLVREEFPGRAFVRGLLISPYIAPVAAVTFTWSFILDPQLGVVNWLALEQGLIRAPIPFLTGHWIEVAGWGETWRLPLALLAVIFFEGWRYFPFAFLFILARLQGIPEEIYHAAAVDGASPVQRFIHITLPQLATVLATLFLFRFIWTINKFDDIFLLTRGQAGTEVITLRIYDYAFGEFNIGAGSAAAVILFGILSAFLTVYFCWILREAE